MSATPPDTLAVDWALTERGRGAPLLLLHGFTGAAASWEDHLDALAARFRVLAPDLPGHGRTRVSTDAAAAADPGQGGQAVRTGAASVEATADALAALLARSGAAPARVVGYSMGARVALRLAVAHPRAVARLVLESPSAGIADPAERSARRAADDALAGRIERDGIEAFVTSWERSPVFAGHAAADPALVARQRAIRLASDPAGLAASLRAAGQGAMEPLHERLADVATPTLVVAGALDPAGRPRAEAVAAGIPGARLTVLDGVGHTPHLEAPRAFDRLVIDFLLEDLPA